MLINFQRGLNPVFIKLPDIKMKIYTYKLDYLQNNNTVISKESSTEKSLKKHEISPVGRNDNRNKAYFAEPLFILLIFILSSNILFAQTPSVTTQQPLVVTPYIYKAGSDTTYTYDAKVTFVGQVNPNGEECSSYFEYGPTASYGNTVAASPAISAGTDNITLAVTTVIHNCEGDYHCRLCVVSGGVTYYGSDMLFAPEVDPTIKLLFTANPSDDPITTSFSITNNNYFPVSLTCTDGTNTDTLKLARNATGDFICNKHSTVSFYYNYTNPDGSIVYPFLFMQMPTNDQTTGDIPSAQSQITISPYGYTANKDSSWYNIANANDADVNLIYIIADSLQWTTIIGKNSNKNIEIPYGDVTFYLNNINIGVFSKPLVKTTYGYFTLLYNTTYVTDNFGDLSVASSFCYAYPQKVYLDASDNSFTSKLIMSNMTEATVTPSQSWINGGSYGNILFNGPFSMSISTNTTGATRTGTVEFLVPHYVIVSSNPLTMSQSQLYCYVTVVQSGLTVPKNNLKLRLRADQGVTSSGDSVSVWNDMSGNGNNATQSNSANQPVYVAGVMNNMPAIRFNGTNSYLSLPTSTALGIQNHDYEMFIVARSSSSNIQFLLSGNSLEQFEYHLNGVGARFIPITATYLDEGTSGAYADGNPHIFEAHASSSGGGMSVDGVNGGTTTANILSSDGGILRLGVRSDGSYYFNGDIAEVLVYDTVLTSAQRDSVEQYLADRYGITSGALPVELTSFTASVGDNKVTLDWQTATEVNNYGFNVERSNPPLPSGLPLQGEDMGWVAIGFIKGSGNSNSPKNYSFVDDNPPSGTVEYRLKQIDNDGNFKYSRIVTVTSLPTKFELWQNYPNPFNPTTTIQYAIPKAEHVTLKVYDELGREVTTLVNENKEAGQYKVSFNGSNLASGIYYYRLSAGDFTEVKKLILLR